MGDETSDLERRAILLQLPTACDSKSTEIVPHIVFLHFELKRNGVVKF